MTPGLIWLLLLNLFIPALVSAQDTSSFALSGIVLDPHQAEVAGAEIILKRADGTEGQSLDADSTGAFRLEGVRLGNYEVRVEQEGCKAFVARAGRKSSSPARESDEANACMS